MKTVAVEETDLARCITASRTGRVVVTRKGKPVAVLVDVRGLDAEQIELGTSKKFWKLIGERRQEAGISRRELESRLTSASPRKR